VDGLDDLLDRSLADPAFKDDVRAFARYHSAPRVGVETGAPRVKLLRVIAQLLDAEPGLPVERVALRGVSGCCDFRGTLLVEAGGATLRFEFVWDCRWRATREGWVDSWGGADQARAAREFGYRCFREWVRADTPDVARGAPGERGG
jgi:hypothetical protein